MQTNATAAIQCNSKNASKAALRKVEEAREQNVNEADLFKEIQDQCTDIMDVGWGVASKGFHCFLLKRQTFKRQFSAD